MIAIDLGHRFGRIARVGPDGVQEVTTTGLVGVDGVLDPGRALPQVIGAATDAHGVEPDGTAFIGLPASGGQKDELRYAVERAGLRVGRAVPDPVAVALHYGAVAEGVDHTVLVCDQGATTLDLSVLSIAPDLTVRMVRGRSLPIGGSDWDAAVAVGLAGRLPDGADPLRAAEGLRRAYGDGDNVTEVVDTSGGRHSLTLDRSGFERAVAPLRKRTLAAVAEQLASARLAVDTVLLAGGMCAVPGLRGEIEALPAARGLTVRRDRPELAVVLGLLALDDFGVLRVVSQPTAEPERAEAWYPGAGSGYPRARTPHLSTPAPRPVGPDAFDARQDPVSADAVQDPEPRAGRPLPEDPVPRSWQRGATAVPDAPGAGRAGQQEAHEPPPESAGPPGPGFPPEPDAPAEPDSTQPPPTGHADATVPGRAQPPETPRPSAARTCSMPCAEDTFTPRATPVSYPHDAAGEAPAASFVDPRPRFAVPVDQLQAIRRGSHLLVLWAWPDGALSARVRWSREGSTDATGDGDVVCRRRVYEHDGGFELAVGPGAVLLTVEALVPELGEFAENTSPLLVPAAPMVVVYEPSVRRRLKGRVASVTFTSESGCRLPGLRIVHSLGRFRPTSTAEGTVLHEVPAQRLSAGTPVTVEFPLPVTRGASWLVCFPADADAATDSGIEIRPSALHRLRVT
ncbi:Hsp70 family protein [Streptomyces sp. NPDC091387]|uniref:Hsp70 family protein n=1 Tax=Streptomyces sp. NPDC091387 TaxID=3365998 RepID=UPI0037F8B5B6